LCDPSLLFMQIGKHVVLASSLIEQAAAHSVVHVSVSSDGRVCGLVKAGRRMLGASILQQLLTAAQRKGKELFLSLQQPLDMEEED
jgi:exosome complex RNA-binding protein Rrp42 (RNase PH superfamily)